MLIKDGGMDFHVVAEEIIADEKQADSSALRPRAAERLALDCWARNQSRLMNPTFSRRITLAC